MLDQIKALWAQNYVLVLVIAAIPLLFMWVTGIGKPKAKVIRVRSRARNYYRRARSYGRRRRTYRRR